MFVAINWNQDGAIKIKWISSRAEMVEVGKIFGQCILDT